MTDQEHDFTKQGLWIGLAAYAVIAFIIAIPFIV